MFNYNNPYYMPAQAYRPMNTPQPQQMYTPQPVQGLQGKLVDSLDVIKAIDIPIDRECFLFPIT